MGKLSKKSVLLMILVLIAGVLSGCGGNGGNTSDNGNGSGAKRDDVVIYCEGVWSSLDPHGPGCETYTNEYLLDQIYESLVFVTDEGEITPMLAKDWSVSDDGLTYTFDLRDDVKFHNGEKMSSADVLYSFERMMSMPALETYYNVIDHVAANGDYSVNIVLKHPFSAFMAYVHNFRIVNKDFSEANSLDTAACGTGAYQLESIELNTKCEMSAFEDYYGGAPAIKKAVWKVITEGTSAVVAFESGDLDFMMCYNPSAFAPLEESGKYNTKLAPTYHTAVILLNNTVPPLDNIKVRQALAYATDRDTMIQMAYEGLAQPTYLMSNLSTFGVTEENFVNPYPYDLEKAKTLLAQAGYPNGFDLGDMTVISGSYHEKYAQVWQQSLSQIGVKINLVGSESCVADTTAHNFVTATMGEGFITDFDYCRQFYTGDNKCLYSNDRVTELFDLASKEVDTEKRAEMYDEAIKIIQDEVPCLPIFNKEIPWVWDKNLNASPHLDSGRPYFVKEMSWN